MLAAPRHQFIAASCLKDLRAIGSQIHSIPLHGKTQVQHFLGTLHVINRGTPDFLLPNFLAKLFPSFGTLVPPLVLPASPTGHVRQQSILIFSFSPSSISNSEPRRMSPESFQASGVPHAAEVDRPHGDRQIRNRLPFGWSAARCPL